MSRRQETMDGNTAAAYVSYAFTEVAAIFPITPSSPMPELIDEWSAVGKKNIFGDEVIVQEMQSEGGAAATVHGILQSGALATTYTASQGLLLMIPNMYKIAGELLPAVFHVAARSLASNILSIFGDHQDVMSARQTGCAILASSNVQQAMDLGAVTHLSAIQGRIPTIHFFDGFRTSHETQKIEVLEYEELSKLVDYDAIDAFRNRSLSPNQPVLRGVTANDDIFFQLRESVNTYYDQFASIVEANMEKINKLTGRDYRLFNYHGAPDAENVVVVMGSAAETVSEVAKHLNEQGEKIGVVEVHLFRPFINEKLLEAIPKTAKRIAVLDRTKEPGTAGEPLLLDVKNAFYHSNNSPKIVGGRYGLASKDFQPIDALAVIENLLSEKPKDHFTVGIEDDVTNTSIRASVQELSISPKTTISCKFWGYGSDGTVSANKSAIKIIGDKTNLFTQAYFAFDAKKSGGLTVSHLRFGSEPIREPYLVKNADFIACHNQSYVYKYDLLDGIKENGVFLLNCTWSNDELDKKIPANLKRIIIDKKLRVYTINAAEIASEIGLGERINIVMQAAFFHLVGIIPEESAKEQMREEIQESYGNRGADVVIMNNRAVEKGFECVQKIETTWTTVDYSPEKGLEVNSPAFVKNILTSLNRQKGDELPVSAFTQLGLEDGTFPLGGTQWEKREIATTVPKWLSEKCIQCNQCSFVCPHAVIRPILVDDSELKNAPNGFTTLKAIGKGVDQFRYHIAISGQDCTGCGNCIDVCPSEALEYALFEEKRNEYIENWNFAIDIKDKIIPDSMVKTVKGSQFKRPLLEFSGACAGCGETPYAKLVTQLFGDRMMISESAGCSTVWGGSPQVSFTKNQEGYGPSWGFSLFEDNAEYGLGMLLGVKHNRNSLLKEVEEALDEEISPEVREALIQWKDGFNESNGTRERANILTNALKDSELPSIKRIASKQDYFIKRSHWIMGGDGWAYDIGFGGLDHVLASGENINVLVFDTEVYSNTGGQSSKATPLAAVAKFSASGKKNQKKDLGMMAMSYGYVYVAQIAMGASPSQTLRAILEAEAYEGPSLIIAYCPCVAHGIRGGMSQTQSHEKRAVESGYWTLFRYNPELSEGDNNPFILDSKQPKASFRDFLLSEVRYSSLYTKFPEIAESLFEKAENDAMKRYLKYKQLSDE